MRPVTFAARLLHVGRYGGSSEDERLWPLFVGYSTLVRGYDPNSFDTRDCTPTPDGSCPELIRLTGSRMLVFNGEVRIPAGGLFTGGLDYGPVPVELFGFFDAGAAWTRDEQLSLGDVGRWVRSAGAGARVNVFGYLVAEFNAARPLDRKGRGWMYVFNLRPSF
jgi:outer membrane protein assembly factor BamA